MPAERVSMRQIREVLRLRFASKLPQRAIAKSLGLSQGGGERLSQPGPRRRGELSPLAILQEIGFALDSLLEGDGFEPSVPRRGQHFSRPPRNPRLRNRPGCQNRILTIDKGRFYRAPSQARPGNDINAGSAGFQEARHRGDLDKRESG